MGDNCGYQVHSAVIPYFITFMIHKYYPIAKYSIISNIIIIIIIIIILTGLGMYNGGTDSLFGLPLYLVSRILVALTLV
jgi:hypothetical protein